jgi:hypothetical protein
MSIPAVQDFYPFSPLGLPHLPWPFPELENHPRARSGMEADEEMALKVA